MRWRLRVRAYLVVLVLAALLPVVTFAAVAIVRLAHLERETSEQAMREMARALSLAVDRELTGARSALLFLVGSPHLRSSDLQSFHRQAVDALTLRGTSIVLADPSGDELLSTARAFGAARTAADEIEAVKAVAETGRPLVSDVLVGAHSRRPFVAVSVPVYNGPRVRYVLSMLLPPESLSAILLEQTQAPLAMGALYDRHGVAITSTRAAAKAAGVAGAVGAVAPAGLVAAFASSPEGFLRERTADGARAYFAFSRSRFSGFTVSLAEPASSFDAALRRSLWTLGAGGILATLLALGMTTLVGARISGSIGALAAAAPALLAGRRRFEMPPSPLREINDLAGALDAARETMLRQSRDVVATNRTLQILLRAAHQINSVLQTRAVMRTLVRSAMELVDGAGGMAGLVTDGHVVVDEYQDGHDVRPIDLAFAPGHGMAGHVVKTAQPYIANDAAHDPVVAADVQQRLGFTSCVTVPIFRPDGQVVGCFQVHDKRDGQPFDEEDVVLLEGLAASAAIALENARLLVEREAADHAKDQFLATLSHELRTPLTAILGWTRMLRSGRLDPSAQTTALETIERNTRLQTQLIEDLLDVSRIISGKLTLDPQPVELGTVVEAAAQSLRSVADAKGVALRVTIEPGGDLVEGDPHRLQQVVLNLLSNAIKFTPAEGRVEVHLTRADDRARLVVRDTGLGIAPEVLPHVFDRFRQADGTHTKQHGGLGLGLAIVRHLVVLHGGTARAESEGRGRGATFTVELPLAGTLAREASRPRARRGGARDVFDCPPVLEGLRVLVVEDDPDGRRYAIRVLEECKAEVIGVGSAVEALGILARFRPHVLVSDIGMPRMDGYDLLRAVRSRPAQDGGLTPALALTAYASTEDRARALGAGYQRHLAKPIDPADLVEAVAELADHAAGAADATRSADGVRTMGA